MFSKLDSLEKANFLTHLPGVIFGVCTLALVPAMQSSWSVVLFVLTFILMFSTSSLYHWESDADRKKKWRVLDHIAIYILIAGTYTPFVKLFVDNQRGLMILIVLWSCVVAGAILKIFFTGRFKLVSTIIYLIMGWIGVFAANDFICSIPNVILYWILAGGVFYSLGTIFYLRKNWRPHHAVWHLFVLVAALCHWIGVYLAVESY